ncbi:MAG: ester cyclase [Rhodoferax sp.]|jgi:predicted ester cyclase|uniref:ester cyclase n=1 Tax=Rhodoferax sp. TaxID=50421 RepID=UPI001B78846F|nr:ester cyclase [Rhodoferax sp.]MBP8285213.1 ester cyclase [Rhodoferax sp.]MBP9148003.1 ester cyclase [Rhodoferax sp.]MBP9734125.1 ester cyclase [Rhodoferax sp.]
MTQDELQTIVASFYQKALTVNTDTNPGAVLDKILADSFQSINSQEVKDKATLIKQVGFFWQIIPDLVWEPQDLVIGVDGKKVVVRSVATGSPKGNFMGLPLDGSRSFRIDTTDIHEIEHGQIVCVHHLEDWATGMKQLKG